MSFAFGQSATPPRRPSAINPATASELTGSTSGSASPSTRYGSFPPSTIINGEDIRDRLSKHASIAQLGVEEAELARSRRAKVRGKSVGKDTSRRQWSRSTETLLRPDDEDVYDPDAEHSDSTALNSDDPEQIQRKGTGLGSVDDAQYGVLKMELISKNWGRRGWSIYAGYATRLLYTPTVG